MQWFGTLGENSKGGVYIEGVRQGDQRAWLGSAISCMGEQYGGGMKVGKKGKGGAGHLANWGAIDSSKPCQETKNFSVLNEGSISWHN